MKGRFRCEICKCVLASADAARQWGNDYPKKTCAPCAGINVKVNYGVKSNDE